MASPKYMKLTLEQQYMLSANTANTMPADALANLGASASAGMAIDPQRQNIPTSASEELIKWINLNRSMDKPSNYLSIPKFQQQHGWSLEMDKWFHPTIITHAPLFRGGGDYVCESPLGL